MENESLVILNTEVLLVNKSRRSFFIVTLKNKFYLAFCCSSFFHDSTFSCHLTLYSLFSMLYMVFIMFFSSIISVQYFKKIIYISLLNISFCSHIIFLSSLTCLSVFSWPLSFLKIIVWILFSGNSEVSISLRSVTGKLLFSIRGIMFFCFFTLLMALHLYVWT